MAEGYVSTTMPTGLSVKEALNRISQYVPASFVWVEIPQDVTVDLSNPFACDLINGPGDYTIYNFTNGPVGVVTTPLNVNIRQKPGTSDGVSVFVFDGLNSFIGETGGSWEKAEVKDDSQLSIYRGSNEPPDEDVYWLDTSHLTDEDPYVDLKYHNGTKWLSIFDGNDDVALSSTYDKAGKKQDIYQYLTTAINLVNADIGEFQQHITNQMALVHLSSDKRQQFNTTMLTAAQVADLINTIYSTQLNSAVSTKLEQRLKHENSVTIKNDFTSALAEHEASHITEEDATNWEAKASSGHTHDKSANVTINGSDIISGIFPLSQIPDEVKERYYSISSLSELADTSITDADRKGKYHKGNSLYLSTTDSDGNTSRRWFRIMDPSKIGTADYMDGILEFSNIIPEVIWTNIVNKPTTVAGYGIESEVDTKTEIDSVFDPIKSEYQRLHAMYAELNDYVQFTVLSGKSPLGNYNDSTQAIRAIGIRSEYGIDESDMLPGTTGFEIVVLVESYDSGSFNSEVCKIFKSSPIGYTKDGEYRLIDPGLIWVEWDTDDPIQYFSDRFGTTTNVNGYPTRCIYVPFGSSMFIDSNMITEPDILIRLEVAPYNTGESQDRVNRLIVELSKYNWISSIANIRDYLDLQLAELPTLQQQVYDKLGTPSSVSTTGKLVEGIIPVNVAQAVESTVEMPELT